MGIYKDVMSTLVRVLAADNIDNSTKQSWQKLIDADVQRGGNGSSLSPRDKFDYDCCLYALLHRLLEPAEWDVLVAKYSTHKANKVAAIGRLVARMVSPAPQLFVYKALTAWAIPKMKGVQTAKRSTDMIVLPAEFYDMNTWDPEGKPESTRRRWRTSIAKRLEQLEESAVISATDIFDKEEIFIDAA
ncbi:hypothetical protein [Pseudomonas mediterranea]|uniref:Uncharacterized protein n=1 Tax=Pseudomonas mediterranea TaxID=183795 RepID=A0AAX2DJ07_9PSED|nr:hypothetical protein [Pseudomonas mediterranea]KGU84840.1 hypothetical protein N005_15880 [Pseudomonas mediterranea CFBP 5447]SDU74716.1 hypothetical protein SAMN05216476_5269 [Pseudomonas mediterranea]